MDNEYNIGLTFIISLNIGQNQSQSLGNQGQFLD